MIAFCLFQVLSTVQQTTVSLELHMRKAAPWHNSLLRKFVNGILYGWAFGLEDLVQRFQNVLVSIWWQCRRLKKSWMSPMVIIKLWQLRSITDCPDKKRADFIGEILAIINKDPTKSLRSIAKDMGLSDFVRQIVYEDIWYFSYKVRKGKAFSLVMKDKREDYTTNSSIWTGFGFYQRRKNSNRMRWWTHRSTVGLSRSHKIYQ